ncbi:hypothetical protein TIFTF001_045477 [Ficus carica]|uniref:Uncharacterized protein n=1 Tax=Ficus carica TaxID=3494 RepID=A0AA88CLL3_FICCA|nr:hypothetical protein TIFTF001_045477 [Ficus carica]
MELLSEQSDLILVHGSCCIDVEITWQLETSTIETSTMVYKQPSWKYEASTTVLKKPLWKHHTIFRHNRVAMLFPHRYSSCREPKSDQIAPTIVPYTAVGCHHHHLLVDHQSCKS